MKMISRIETPHGSLMLPAFLPDATRAVVRAVDSSDLENCGVRAVVVNTFHLLNRPGVRILSRHGIHGFMGWNRPVVSDSGGFQIYSLLADNPKSGSVTSDGFVYRNPGGKKKISLTPEKSIQRQFRLGSDIMVTLDHCMHPAAEEGLHRESVENTVEWAKRCKTEFEKQLDAKKFSEDNRPLLFAVIQGGEDRELRRECAERLIEIGFDGYAYGGWPLDDQNELVESVGWVAELIPDEFPKFALGIASPDHVTRCVGMGYNLFDGAYPTRDARRGRLYAFRGEPSERPIEPGNFHDRIYITDSKFSDDHSPVDVTCDCMACAKYSRAYIHHLQEIEDPLGYRLATIHNLRFMMRLMSALGNRIDENKTDKISWAVNMQSVVEQVRSVRKYRNLSEDTIGRVVEWASERESGEKAIIKVAKRKLHQVYGVFLNQFNSELVKSLLDEMEKTSVIDARKRLCRRILESHQSTSERMSIMEKAWEEVFGISGKPRSVLDIACGLNPFAIPFMGLPKKTKYIAYDIDVRIADYLNRFFAIMGIAGRAECRDILVRPYEKEVDVALLLKTIPSLEQQSIGSGREIIENLKAKCVVVSYPTASLSGIDRGMAENYHESMMRMISGLEVEHELVEFSGEVFYVIKKTCGEK